MRKYYNCECLLLQEIWSAYESILLHDGDVEQEEWHIYKKQQIYSFNMTKEDLNLTHKDIQKMRKRDYFLRYMRKIGTSLPRGGGKEDDLLLLRHEKAYSLSSLVSARPGVCECARRRDGVLRSPTH